MLRDVGLEDISDGRLYRENDMVKTDTNSCQGCKKICCIGMGRTIVLDPYDCYRLGIGTGKTFEQLLDTNIELNMVDGCILPNIKMQTVSNGCSFLGADNRCTIHNYRPGICRMFPLGRYWEDDEHFYYILQKGECNKDNLTKIKVRKWIGIDNIESYNSYVIQWHSYIKKVQRALAGLSEEQIKILNMYNLRTFYMKGYEADKFFEEFKERLDKSIEMFGL